jgi:hypothetical protein
VKLSRGNTSEVLRGQASLFRDCHLKCARRSIATRKFSDDRETIRTLLSGSCGVVDAGTSRLSAYACSFSRILDRRLLARNEGYISLCRPRCDRDLRSGDGLAFFI